MNPKYTIILILIISGLITLSLAILALGKKKVNGSIFYFLMMISICVYSLGYAFELYNTTLPGIMTALKIEYLTIVYIPVFWFFLAVRYTGYINLTGLKHYLPFLIVPLVSQILVMTVEHHSLYYINTRVETAGPFSLIQFENGFWYNIQTAYTNLMILAGNILFGKLAFNASGKHRSQAITAFAASLIPWAGNIIYFTGASPYGIDLTPLSLAATGPLFAFAIFRYKMFDLTPIARSRIFDIIRDPVIVLDNEDRLVDLNKAAIEFLDLQNSKPTGKSIDILFAEHSVLREQICGSKENNCDTIKREGQETKYYKSRIELIRNSSQNPIGKILILNDNTAEQLLIEKLNQAATTDELTGINNRRNLMNLCHQEFIRSRRYAVPLSFLMIDLDYFKKINDTYGHPCGDETLRRAAGVLRKNLREGDILGRYGGEEFVIMLHHTNAEKASLVAERFRTSIIDEHIEYNGHIIPLTVSIGLSNYKGEEETSLEILISQADTALYRAKRNGRNRVEVY